MGEFRSSRNNASSRVKNQLKTIKLSARKVKIQRVAVVDLGMSKRGGNSLNSSRPIVKSISDSVKISNGEETRFRKR